MAMEVILVLLVIHAVFRLSNGLGSYELEIT
jgi:hypothetical protein